jgi:hypothetical protein
MDDLIVHVSYINQSVEGDGAGRDGQEGWGRVYLERIPFPETKKDLGRARKPIKTRDLDFLSVSI